MGWTSQDDLINQITNNGKFGQSYYNKLITPAQSAGTWSDLTVLAGYPVADTYAGTSLTWVATDESSTGALPHGGNVSTATKHFLNAAGQVGPAAAGAPWILMCVDQLGYVPITGADVTGTGIRTVTMTALGGGARYANGAGCRAYFSTEVAPATGGPNLTSFVYTNSTPTTGKTCPVTVGFAATPPISSFPHTGNAATRYGPFIPLAAGDTGIADFETFTLSGGTAYTGTGQLVLHLVKPLWQIPLVASGMMSERDFLNMMPSLPRIVDGAYLKFLLFHTGATSNNTPMVANFDYAWGG
jgi:hypothetical protein